MKDELGISKIIKISLQNLNGFQIIRILKTVWLEWHYFFDPNFAPSWTWPFLAIFHNTKPRDRADFNPVFLF